VLLDDVDDIAVMTFLTPMDDNQWRGTLEEQRKVEVAYHTTYNKNETKIRIGNETQKCKNLPKRERIELKVARLLAAV
jgi:hypothetical protein